MSPKDGEKVQIMYAQPDSDDCLIKCLKKCMAKLHPKCEALFQKLKIQYHYGYDCWFQNQHQGVHTLENLMK